MEVSGFRSRWWTPSGISPLPTGVAAYVGSSAWSPGTGREQGCPASRFRSEASGPSEGVRAAMLTRPPCRCRENWPTCGVGSVSSLRAGLVRPTGHRRGAGFPTWGTGQPGRPSALAQPSRASQAWFPSASPAAGVARGVGRGPAGSQWGARGPISQPRPRGVYGGAGPAGRRTRRLCWEEQPRTETFPENGCGSPGPREGGGEENGALCAALSPNPGEHRAPTCLPPPGAFRGGPPQLEPPCGWGVRPQGPRRL